VESIRHDCSRLGKEGISSICSLFLTTTLIYGPASVLPCWNQESWLQVSKSKLESSAFTISMRPRTVAPSLIWSYVSGSALGAGRQIMIPQQTLPPKK
jgi:hypothetical protein